MGKRGQLLTARGKSGLLLGEEKQKQPGFHVGGGKKKKGASASTFAGMRERQKQRKAAAAKSSKSGKGKGHISPAREKLTVNRETRTA